MFDQPKIIILFGRSGCGKGTQAKLLRGEFGFDYLSSGDLLRNKIKDDDFSGRKLRDVLKNGELAPTFLMFQLWSEKIREIKNKNDLKGLIIDGSPRALAEAKLIDEVFEWYEWEDVKIILLDISDDEAFGRLTKRRICKNCGRLIPWVGDFKNLEKCDKCGGELETRPDDKPEAIRARLDYYNKDVQPAVDYYEKTGALIRINGEQPIKDVYQGILKVL